MFRFGRLQIEIRDVCFDQVWKKQMREGRQPPRVCFFLVENKVNDFAQSWISLLVIVLQSLFQLRHRG